MQRFGRWILATAFGATVALTAALPAHADVTFDEKNNPPPGSIEENVMFQTTGTGLSIIGLTNQSDIPVQFSSTEIIEPSAAGQADIIADEGLLENLTITIPGGYYTDLILNPMVTLGALKADGGTMDVSVTTDDGVFTHSYTIGNGENYLTIVAINDEKILSTTLTMQGEGNFADLKQPRISGAALLETASKTPEPCSLALLGLGALPLATRLRRRQA